MRVIFWITLWLRRLIFFVILFAILTVAPVAYIEFGCKGTPLSEDYASLLPAEHWRDEGRTYLGFSEEYIVNAYDDYAQVVADGDPHDFKYITAVTGYWTSLCPLAKKASEHNGFSGDTKKALYTNGVSFTAHFLLKGLYEETLGRLATVIRGDTRAPLDDISAGQSARYAQFVKQNPWHEWNFSGDAQALWAGNTRTARDWERAVALSTGNRLEGLFAGVMGSLFSAQNTRPRSTRVIVKDISPDALSAIPGVTVTGTASEGVEAEIVSGNAFTASVLQIIQQRGEFVEIAGNDDIMLSVITPSRSGLRSLKRFERPDTNDYRHLIELKVWGMSDRIRELEGDDVAIERIYDY